MGPLQKVTLVVPCYNEAARLDGNAFVELTRDGDVEVLFVDDGSTDSTKALLSALCAQEQSNRTFVSLARNRGKAEAVRDGMRHAIEGGAQIVGYFDADLSTPPREMKRLVALMRAAPAVQVVIGARIIRLGADIHRNAGRHYLGRIFASVASLVLPARVYDTQCGAKLFRASATLRDALEEPFISAWAFDVELLGRLLVGSENAAPVPQDAFLEVPLEEWRDVAGSKLRLSSMLKAGAQLIGIHRALRRRQRQISSPVHKVDSKGDR